MSDLKLQRRMEEENLKERDTEEPTSEEAAEQSEEIQVQDQILTLADDLFKLHLASQKEIEVDGKELEETKTRLMGLIKEKSMGHWYEYVCDRLNWIPDMALVEQFQKANEEELSSLNKKVEDAAKTAGETEIREAKLARANFFARVGDKQNALEAYEEVYQKSVGSGARIDLVFSILRLALACDDFELYGKQVARARNLVAKGGDWERRNLLHIYEATHFLISRQFSEASSKLLDSIATFTNYSLYSYNQFVTYAVVIGAMTLDRVSLRAKIIKSPEILSVIREVPHLQSFVNALYECRYADLFRELVEVATLLSRDRYLRQHVSFLVRELRIVAYAQFLQSYKSVTLSSMAHTFGISEAFLDRELSRFISTGRINAKIDKVSGAVETTRLDQKNQQFSDVIKLGDVLLNRVQKLSKVTTY